MHYKFSQHKKSEIKVRLDGVEALKCKQFRYLGSLFQENGMMDKYVTHQSIKSIIG